MQNYFTTSESLLVFETIYRCMYCTSQRSLPLLFRIGTFNKSCSVYMIRHLWPNQAVTVYTILSTIFIAYLCRFQPFKHTINNFIFYIYLLCLNLICILVKHYSVTKLETSKDYVIMIAIIIHIALAIFTLIVAYHIWKFILCRYSIFVKLELNFTANMVKYSIFGTKKTTNSIQRSVDKHEKNCL